MSDDLEQQQPAPARAGGHLEQGAAAEGDAPGDDRICALDGARLGPLEPEHACVVCGAAVCTDHSTEGRRDPRTGEAGRACDRCLGQTIDSDDMETYVAHVFRELKRHQEEAVRPVREAVTGMSGRADELAASAGAVACRLGDLAERQALDASAAQTSLRQLTAQLDALGASVSALGARVEAERDERAPPRSPSMWWLGASAAGWVVAALLAGVLMGR